jgi:hypothetical protein
MKSLIFFLLLFLIIFNHTIFAQILVTVIIKDKETNEPLPAANIQIGGTYRGTISNDNGKFQLEIPELPATILISYIGYESQKIEISQKPNLDLYIFLTPIPLEGKPLLVVAEDPALEIMREVIRRKQIWRKDLHTFKSDAYSRMVFENDSGIVSIAESISETFWDKEKGSREVIKSKRQTSNLSEEQNIAVASYIPNFYDDDIEIIGYQVIGPTHPKAFKYYTFQLKGERRIDNNIVYDIEVIPTSKLQPTFKGRVAVLDSVFALLEVDLVPNESILFPPPIQAFNVHFKQQFSNFGTEVWLPLDFRADGEIKIGFLGLQFPPIIYQRRTRLTDYQINIELPDSLYKSDEIISADSLAIKQDTLFIHKKDIIPLSTREETAYQELDSTMTLEKAYKPTGFLARFVKVEDGNEGKEKTGKGKSLLSGINPQLWYNRVDALHAGLSYQRNLKNRITAMFEAGYSTGIKEWSYGIGVKYVFRNWHQNELQLKYRVGTDTRYHSDNYSITIASLLPLFGAKDYFDYFWNKSFSAKFGYHLNSLNTRIGLVYLHEEHSSLEKQTDFNIFGSDKKQRFNPSIEEGKLRSFMFTINYGESYVPFGVISQKRFSVEIEHSSNDFLVSDFSFTNYKFAVDWQFDTFLKRRLLPNSLDLRIIGGVSSGELPIQRFGIIDANFVAFGPFGTFRTLYGLPYEGEDYFSFFWEHNFRTVPFELLGLKSLARRGIGVIIFGSHGRSWISDKKLKELTYTPKYNDRFHHELGISINSIFNLLRLDTAYRIDKPDFYIGIAFARFF